MSFTDLSDEELYEKMEGFRGVGQAISPAVFSKSELYTEVRRRAKGNLYFLTKYFIGFDNKKNELINEDTHRRVCDLFVRKMDWKSIAEQDTRKERLLLYPRGCFKSMIDCHDAVQWILNFPNIRLLFLTATEELAMGFLGDVRNCFVVRKDKLSFMNVYFPEFCIDDTDRSAMGNAYEFTTPQRTNKQKEPTVLASSIGSTLSGLHFDVMKPDDMVSNVNSETEEQCIKIAKKFYVSKKMLMPYGYLDYIGTRYHDMDLYGELLEKNFGDIVKTDGPNWEYLDNKTTGFQVLIGRAIVPKPDFRHKEIRDLKEEECVLLFPGYLTYPVLLKEWNQDDVVSEGQYNQNPRPTSTTTFDLPLLKAHTVPFTKIPPQGPHTITWDFAFSKKKGRDYSTYAVARWDEKGAMFIVDIGRQRYLPQALAQAVVKSVADWRPMVLGIEDASGSKFLEPAIIAEAQKTKDPDIIRICSSIDWFLPDNQADAKKIRMSSLHPWLIDNRLWFVDHLKYLEILYKEFQVCLVSHRHDDIPDVISQQPRYAPRMQQLMDTNNPHNPYMALSYEDKEQAFRTMVFEEGDAFGRRGLGAPPIPMIPVPVDHGVEADSPYDHNILGAGLFG